MTARTTVALAVLTLGLAVAALAGIPAFIENRSVGDVVVIVGFAVAIVGVLLVVLAIPGQRRENGKLKRDAAVDVEKLRVERRRLHSTRARTVDALRREESSLAMRIPIRAGLLGPDPTPDIRAEIERLKTALIELDASIEFNAAEFKRHGITDPDAAV